MKERAEDGKCEETKKRVRERRNTIRKEEKAERRQKKQEESSSRRGAAVEGARKFVRVYEKRERGGSVSRRR